MESARAFGNDTTSARGLPHYVGENALNREHRGLGIPEVLVVKHGIAQAAGLSLETSLAAYSVRGSR